MKPRTHAFLKLSAILVIAFSMLAILLTAFSSPAHRVHAAGAIHSESSPCPSGSDCLTLAQNTTLSADGKRLTLYVIGVYTPDGLFTRKTYAEASIDAPAHTTGGFGYVRVQEETGLLCVGPSAIVANHYFRYPGGGSRGYVALTFYSPLLPVADGILPNTLAPTEGLAAFTQGEFNVSATVGC